MSYDQCTYDAQGELLCQEEFTYYDWADSNPGMDTDLPIVDSEEQPTYEYFYDPQSGTTFVRENPDHNVYYTPE